MMEKEAIFLAVINDMYEIKTASKGTMISQAISSVGSEIEKDVLYLFSILLQIPVISNNSIRVLSERYHLKLGEVPEKLPDYFYKNFFTYFQKLEKIDSDIFYKISSASAVFLPTKTFPQFVSILLDNPIQNMESIFQIVVLRDPNVIEALIEKYSSNSTSEKVLNSILLLNQHKFSDEIILKIALMFFTGRASIKSPLFNTFLYHILSDENKVPNISEQSKLEKVFLRVFPNFRKILLESVTKTINEYPLPHPTVDLIYNRMSYPLIQQMLITLLKKKSSIQTFYTLSKLMNSNFMKDLYSYVICLKLCQYKPKKKNVKTMENSFASITSLYHEIKIYKQLIFLFCNRSYREFVFKIFETLTNFSETANVLCLLLNCFMNKKELNEKMFSSFSVSSVLTAFYLVGTSKLMLSDNNKNLYKQIIILIFPNLDLVNVQINCKMPKPLMEAVKKYDNNPKKIKSFYSSLLKKNVSQTPLNLTKKIDQIMLFKENNKIPGSLASNHISNNSKISLKPRSKRSLTLKSASTELLGLLPTKKPEIVPTFVILSGHELIQHISKLEEDENPEKNEKKVEKNQIEKDDQNQISEKDESTPQEQPETEDVECQTDDVKNGDKKKKKPIHKRRRRASLKALKKKQKKFYDFELSSDCDRLPVPDFCEFQTSDSDSSEFLELLDDDSIEYFANLIGPINQ